MSQQHGMASMRLTPSERAVVNAMRYSQRSGNAIYRYAMNFDSYSPYPQDPEPYVHEKHPYEDAFGPDPGEETVVD